MADFRKYLIVSNEEGRITREQFSLDRASWRALRRIGNFADYDVIILNLEALAQGVASESLAVSDIESAFDRKTWLQILTGGGRIALIGKPDFSVPYAAKGSPTGRDEPPSTEGKRRGVPSSVSAVKIKFVEGSELEVAAPLTDILEIGIDDRPLEYRRVSRNETHNYEDIYKYLDRVVKWEYSIGRLAFSSAFVSALEKIKLKYSFVGLGQTSYSTVLALRIGFNSDKHPLITLIPATGRGVATDDAFVLKEWYGIAVAMPEPPWLMRFVLPHQADIERELTHRREAIEALQREISGEKQRLAECRKWYRLLFDDGFTLEEIVKDAMEALGARVTKVSKEKDDFRLVVPGHPEGVIEVKGTHKAGFGLPALRQLAGWMDEANAAENKAVKGIFVGNASRNDPPSGRGAMFEKNIESYATIKNMVMLRTTDLYCLVVLRILNILDLDGFWKSLFAATGSFDAGTYWQKLPAPYALRAEVPAK